MYIENRIIKIVTYNIHSGKDRHMILQLDRMIEFLHKEKADIIAIQEINENNQRGYQLRDIHKHLAFNYAFGPNVRIGNGYYGLAIFSSIPIVKSNNIYLPSMKEQRSLLHMVIEINSIPIHIFDTHLGLNYEERNKQLKAIRQHLQPIKSPKILLGDFNMQHAGQHLPAMLDVAQVAKKEDLPTLICSEKRIDYIFVSPDFQVHNYDVIPISFSDHFPLVAQVKVNNKKSLLRRS